MFLFIVVYCCSHSEEASRWEIEPDSLLWHEEIGTGAFGCVYKCTLLLQNNKPQPTTNTNTTVATKTMTGKITPYLHVPNLL